MTLAEKAVDRLWNWVQDARQKAAEKIGSRCDKAGALAAGEYWGVIEPAPQGMKHVHVGYAEAGAHVLAALLTYQPPRWVIEPTADSTDDPFIRQVQAQRIRDLFDVSGAWKACCAVAEDVTIYPIAGVYIGWEIDDEYGVERPVVRRISPYDIIIDPLATYDNWEEARFVGHQMVMYLDDVYRVFPQAKTLGIKGSIYGDSQDFMRDPNAPESASSANPLCTLVEVWFRDVSVKPSDDPKERTDRQNIRVVWALENPKKPLAVHPWPRAEDGTAALRDRAGKPLYPYEFLLFRRVPSSFFGRSAIEIALAQQRELNWARSAELTRATLARGKLLVSQSSLSRQARDALERDSWGDVVVVNDPPGSEPIAPVPVSNLSMDQVSLARNAVQDMTVLQGVTDAQRGVPTQSPRTLGEVELIQAQSGVRTTAYVQRWEEFLERVASKIWQLECFYAHVGDVVTLVAADPETGEKGTAVRVRLTRDMLTDASIRVRTGTARMHTKAERLQAITSFVSVWASLGMIATPATPTGVVNAKWLMERHAEALDLPLEDDAYDLSSMQQAMPPMPQTSEEIPYGLEESPTG